MNRLWSGILLLGCVARVMGQPIPIVPNNSVVNGASFAAQQPVPPGALVTIFGTNLATTLAFADSIPISTADPNNNLAGVKVTFNGVAAPILAAVPDSPAGSGQINAQIPWNVLPSGTTTGTVMVIVTVSGVSSHPTAVQIDPSGPGIFMMNAAGQAAAQVGNSAIFAAPTGALPGLQSRPIKKGEVLVLYATGLGEGNSVVATGDIPHGALVFTKVKPVVMFGGVAADPANVVSVFSPQFVGLNQVNVTVPANAPSGSAVPLQLQMGNVTSTNKVTIAIE